METRMTKVGTLEIMGQEANILGSIESPLFRAQEVASWLGIKNTTQMLNCIPENLYSEHVKKLNCAVGVARHSVLYLTEFGVYFVLMRSRSPKATEFQLKIMEYLKSIRLKGYAVSDSITEEQIAQLKKDAENKEMLLKAQSGVIRVDDRFISSLKKLIDIYENERSKISEINAEDLFEAK